MACTVLTSHRSSLTVPPILAMHLELSDPVGACSGKDDVPFQETDTDSHQLYMSSCERPPVQPLGQVPE